MTIALKGLAWDHRRCWGPLEAYARWLASRGAPVRIEWRRRSLYEFGEAPLDSVLREYDLVVFDHPFIGDVARDALLVPFDAYLDETQKRRFAADSVGPSWPSYQAHGKQWALPIDAAAQVASYRPDLVPQGWAPPASHAELIDFARRLRAAGKWIGLPLVPTDAMCLLLTFASLLGEGVGQKGVCLSKDTIAEAVRRLHELAALAHPASSSWNPIACYEHMVANDDVVYVPFAFGYVNYATASAAPALRFVDIPASPPRGSLLGGAGVGVSAASRHVTAAMTCALELCSPEYQRGEYVTAGGQPGSLGAWIDPEVNAHTRGFFQATLKTLQNAYLRPTVPGFVSFFREVAGPVQKAILTGRDAGALADLLERRYREIAIESAGAGA